MNLVHLYVRVMSSVRVGICVSIAYFSFFGSKSILTEEETHWQRMFAALFFFFWSEKHFFFGQECLQHFVLGQILRGKGQSYLAHFLSHGFTLGYEKPS